MVLECCKSSSGSVARLPWTVSGGIKCFIEM